MAEIDTNKLIASAEAAARLATSDRSRQERLRWVLDGAIPGLAPLFEDDAIVTEATWSFRLLVKGEAEGPAAEVRAVRESVAEAARTVAQVLEAEFPPSKYRLRLPIEILDHLGEALAEAKSPLLPHEAAGIRSGDVRDVLGIVQWLADLTGGQPVTEQEYLCPWPLTAPALEPLCLLACKRASVSQRLRQLWGESAYEDCFSWGDSLPHMFVVKLQVALAALQAVVTAFSDVGKPGEQGSLHRIVGPIPRKRTAWPDLAGPLQQLERLIDDLIVVPRGSGKDGLAVLLKLHAVFGSPRSRTLPFGVHEHQIGPLQEAWFASDVDGLLTLVSEGFFGAAALLKARSRSKAPPDRRSARGKTFAWPAGTEKSWEALRVEMTELQAKVTVTVEDKPRSRNYGFAEMGFGDGRAKNKSPNERWDLLRAMGRGSGRIPVNDSFYTRGARSRAISDTGRHLRQFFQIDDSPFHHVKAEHVYEANFTLRTVDTVTIDVPPGTSWEDVGVGQVDDRNLVFSMPVDVSDRREGEYQREGKRIPYALEMLGLLSAEGAPDERAEALLEILSTGHGRPSEKDRKTRRLLAFLAGLFPGISEPALQFFQGRWEPRFYVEPGDAEPFR